MHQFLQCRVLPVVSILLVCLFSPLMSWAGQAVKAEIAGYLPMQTVGEARMQFLFLPVYESRLLTENGRYIEGQRPVRLEIRYLRNIPARHLVSRTAEEWEKLGMEKTVFEPWVASLAALWPDVSKGDVLAIQVQGDGQSQFFWNGKLLGEMEDSNFGRQFLAIWLSPQSSEPRHRRDLLGGGQG